jgi:hypothetical protein
VDDEGASGPGGMRMPKVKEVLARSEMGLRCPNGEVRREARALTCTRTRVNGAASTVCPDADVRQAASKAQNYRRYRSTWVISIKRVSFFVV